MHNEELHKCRVCGYRHKGKPWGPYGDTPTYDFCKCCGVEFGYGDCQEGAIRNHLERWKRGDVKLAAVTYEDWLAKKEQEAKGNDRNT